jgi:hypothetical protein
MTVGLMRTDASAVAEFRDTGIGTSLTICRTFLSASTVPTKPARASLEELDWVFPSHAGLRKPTEVPSKFKARRALGRSFVFVCLSFRARSLQ